MTTPTTDPLREWFKKHVYWGKCLERETSDSYLGQKAAMTKDAFAALQSIVAEMCNQARIDEVIYAEKMVGVYGYVKHFELRKAELTAPQTNVDRLRAGREEK